MKFNIFNFYLIFFYQKNVFSLWRNSVNTLYICTMYIQFRDREARHRMSDREGNTLLKSSYQNKGDLYTVRNKACLNSFKFCFLFFKLYRYLNHLYSGRYGTFFIKIGNSILHQNCFYSIEVRGRDKS